MYFSKMLPYMITGPGEKKAFGSDSMIFIPEIQIQIMPFNIWPFNMFALLLYGMWLVNKLLQYDFTSISKLKSMSNLQHV